MEATAGSTTLQAAVNTVPVGEPIYLAGDLREDVKISRPVRILPKPGVPSSYTGRLWLAVGADGTVWESVKINGRSASQLPSPTVNAARVTFRGTPEKPLEVTNENTGIAFDLNGYGGGKPDDFRLENFWIHHVGRIPQSNHEHGYYQYVGRRAILRNGLIHDCADRGIQLWASCHDALVENVAVLYCGQILEIGGGDGLTPSSGNRVRKCILGYAQGGPGGTYVVMSNGPVGPGNVIDDNIVWSPPNHPNYLAGLTMTNTRNVDPKFVNPAGRDFKLQDGSPALGYGPSWLQPGAAPAPQPVPLDRAATLAAARAHMTKTTITYKTWLARKASGYYLNPDATEWAQAERELDKLG